MAAIAYPHFHDRRGRRPVPLGDPRPARRARAVRPVRRQTAAAYRRRRLAALALVVGAVLLARAALVWLGGGPLTASEPAPPRPPAAVSAGADRAGAPGYVVRPGDTLWTIARQLQPAGDVRPLVSRLSAARQGAPLEAGERITLPD